MKTYSDERLLVTMVFWSGIEAVEHIPDAHMHTIYNQMHACMLLHHVCNVKQGCLFHHLFSVGLLSTVECHLSGHFRTIPEFNN